MFNLAKDWGWMEDNPALSIEKYLEEKRDRWLNDKELEKLWFVLDRYPTQFTAYVFKLLLLTGARKGEALNAPWDQFDLIKWHLDQACAPNQTKKERAFTFVRTSGECSSSVEIT
jgi:integrase